MMLMWTALGLTDRFKSLMQASVGCFERPSGGQSREKWKHSRIPHSVICVNQDGSAGRVEQNFYEHDILLKCEELDPDYVYQCVDVFSR